MIIAEPVILLALLFQAAPAVYLLAALLITTAVSVVILRGNAREEMTTAQSALYRVRHDHLQIHRLTYRYLSSICQRAHPTAQDLKMVHRAAHEAAMTVTRTPAIIKDHPELVIGAATQLCRTLGVISAAGFKRMSAIARRQAIAGGAIPADAPTLEDTCQALSRQFTKLADQARDARDAQLLKNQL